jgi:hypothetical protein
MSKEKQQARNDVEQALKRAFEANPKLMKLFSDYVDFLVEDIDAHLIQLTNGIIGETARDRLHSLIAHDVGAKRGLTMVREGLVFRPTPPVETSQTKSILI